MFVWQPPPVPKQGPITLRSLGMSVYLPSILFFIGDGGIIAIVALAARDLGASPAVAGLIVALRGVGVLVFDIPAGWALTRFGEVAYGKGGERDQRAGKKRRPEGATRLDHPINYFRIA